MKKRIISIVLILAVLVLGGLLAGKALIGKQVNVSWYSEDKTEFVIETADQLYELVTLSEKYDLTGKTFKLGADIVINEGNASDWATTAPARKWYPIKNFAGTFDGQGHTISGLYASIYDNAMGLFVETQKGAVIKDFKLVNTYFKVVGSPGTAAVAGGVKNTGTFEKIYTDAIIDCDGHLTGGIVSSINGTSTISECWFDGTITRYFYNHTGGGIVAQVNTTTLNMEHCLNSGTIVADKAKDWIRIGGLCGLVAGRGHLNAVDCLMTGTIDSVTTKQVGSVIGFVGTSSTSALDAVFATKESYGVGVGTGDERVQGGAIRLEEKNMTGYNGYSWTHLDFENYWTVDPEGTPILKYFAENEVSLEGVTKNYDIDWYTGKSAEYTLNTRDELYGFALLSSSKNFSGVVVKLGSDIVVNEGDAKDWAKEAPANFWIPISNWTGIFDGQGHTISGIYMDGEGAMGMFHKTKMDSVIKNFRLTNSYFNNRSTITAYTGSVVGILGGELNTVYSDAIMSSTGIGVGGMVGSASTGKPKIVNCWFDGSINLYGEKAHTAAGMVASVTTPTIVEHCLNTGSVTAERTENYNRLGGMAGVVGTQSVLTVRDSLNVGVITAGEVIKGKKAQAGAVIGFVGTTSSAVLDTVCGTLESAGSAIGQGEERCTGLPIQYAREDLLGIGGYQWTNLDFANYWAAVNNSTPELKSFASSQLSTSGVARKFDISWYSADKKSYTISDAADLYGIAMLTGAGENFEGKTIKLSKDIVVNAGDASTWGTNPPADSWIPIANFLGTFDGQGHTISGLYKNGGTNIALFANAQEKTVIKNVAVENSYFANKTATGNVYIAGIVAQGGGTIDTVYSDVIIETTGVGAGGILACANIAGAKIKNAWFAGNISLLGEDAHSASGIVAIVQQDISLETCLNAGTLSAERTEKYTRLGGLLGVVGNKSTAKIKDSLSVGAINSVKKQAGSVVGYLASNVVFDSDVYASSESYSVQIGQKTGESTGSVNKVGVANLKGEKAKTNASGLDFDKYWMTLSKRTPILKSFASNAPELVLRGMTPDTNWYNKTDKTFIITTAEQLYGVADLSYDTDFAGVTIKLGADITVNTGNASDWKTNSPKYVWEPIQTFAGTFDGQGYTISGLYNGDGKNVGLFSETTAESVVKNLSIKNTYFANMESTGLVHIGSVAGQGGGTFDTIYSDAILESTGQGVGGIIGFIDVKNTKLNQCWFDGQVTLKGENAYSGAGMAAIIYADTEMTDCLNSAPISNSRTENYNRVGSVAGVIANNSTVTVKKFLNVGTVSAGTVPKDKKQQSGSIVGYLASIFKAEGVYTTSESNAVTVGQRNTSTGKVEGSIVAAKKESYLGKGAFSVATTMDYKTVWAAIEGKTPILRSFLGDAVAIEPSTYDTSWYDEVTTNFTITTVEQLYALAELSKEYNFAGQTFELGNDLTVNSLPTGQTAEYWKNSANAPEKVWTPIGTSDVPFAGTFDGKGFTISGLYKDGGSNIGLFAYTATTAVVKNLRLVDTYFGGSEFVGAIAGQGGGTFDTIYTDAYLLTTNRYSGGIIARVNLPITDASKEANLVTNCWFDGTIDNTKTKYADSTGAEAGGIVGRLMDKATMTVEHCLVSGTIKSAISDKNLRIGGICGCIATEGSKLTIKDNLVISNFDVKVTTQTGTVAGFVTKTTVEYTDDVYALKSGSLKLIGQNSNGTVTGNSDYAHDVEEISLLKDQAAYTNAEGLFETDTWWMAVKDSTPVLRSFKGDSVEVDKPTTPPPTPPTPAEPKEITEYNTTDKEFTIKNVDQLYKFAELSASYDFAGQTIYLVDDIVVNKLSKGQTAEDWATTAPSQSWTPIGTSAYPFKGIFDGKDYTISGLYASGTNLNNFGLFGRLDGGTIKNVRLMDTYFGVHKTSAKPGDVFCGSIVGSGNGTIQNVYSNAIISSDKGNGLGGIIGTARIFDTDQALTIENSWFDGKITMTNGGIHGGGILGMNHKDNSPSTMSINNCLNTGSITETGVHSSYKYDRIGGIVGLAQGTATMTITSCLNIGTVSGDTKQYGAIIGMIGGSANVTLSNVYAMEGSCTAYYGQNSNSNVTIDENFVAKADLQGDNAKTNASGLDFTNTWLAQEGKTPILKYFYWYNPEKTVLTIRTVEELYEFAALSAETDFAGKTIRLGANIVVNTLPEGQTAAYWKDSANTPTKVWTPIGTAEKPFAGTFDGKGHTISGLYYSSTTATNVGLFGYTATTAVIRDLRLEDSYFKGKQNVGSISSQGGGTFDTIYTNAYLETTDSFSGGIIAVVNVGETLVTNCWFAGTIENTKNAKDLELGGIVGRIKDGSIMTVQHCMVSGTIKGINTNDRSRVGGICGCISTSGSKLILADNLIMTDIQVQKLKQEGTVVGFVTNTTVEYAGDVYLLKSGNFNQIGQNSNGTIKEAATYVHEVTDVSNLYGTSLILNDIYWKLFDSATPVLKSFYEEPTVSIMSILSRTAAVVVGMTK